MCGPRKNGDTKPGKRVKDPAAVAVAFDLMAGCVVCGRAVPTGGNTLDGYEPLGNLCSSCSRDELRARGLDHLADSDERSERTARLFWQMVGGAALALLFVILLGAVLG